MSPDSIAPADPEKSSLQLQPGHKTRVLYEQIRLRVDPIAPVSGDADAITTVQRSNATLACGFTRTQGRASRTEPETIGIGKSSEAMTHLNQMMS